MSYYDDIYEVAADDYGLVSSATAQKMGVPAIELVKLAKRGRLIHVGRGLYRLARYVPTPYDSYAEAVALVGPEAYLFGESVIAMHGLAPTNPKIPVEPYDRTSMSKLSSETPSSSHALRTASSFVFPSNS